jgi:hypothetical protein
MNGYMLIFIVAIVVPLAATAIILSWELFRAAVSLSHHSFHRHNPHG